MNSFNTNPNLTKYSINFYLNHYSTLDYKNWNSLKNDCNKNMEYIYNLLNNNFKTLSGYLEENNDEKYLIISKYKILELTKFNIARYYAYGDDNNISIELLNTNTNTNTNINWTKNEIDEIIESFTKICKMYAINIQNIEININN